MRVLPGGGAKRTGFLAMDWHAAGLRRLDGIIWAVIAAVAGIVLAATEVSAFHLVWRSFAAAGAATAILLVAHWFYRDLRPDPRLSNALAVTAQIVAFAAVGAPLSYIAASFDLPLQDRWMDAADRLFGLDWSALLRWMDAHAAIHPLFNILYESLMPQTLAVVLILALAGRFRDLRVFVLAFMFAALITIAVAAVLPAEGVWGYYRLHASDYPDIIPAVHGRYLPDFLGLRDGSVRQLVAAGAHGIITFPSLHAALALILIDAFRPLPVLRWIGLVTNGLMMVAIPVDGGHYFIDIFAGLAIAAFCLAAARALVARLAAAPQAVENLAVTEPATEGEPVPVPVPSFSSTAR